MHNCNNLALDNYILQWVCCYCLLKSRKEIVLIVILGDFFPNNFLCTLLTGNFLKRFISGHGKFAERGDNRWTQIYREYLAVENLFGYWEKRRGNWENVRENLAYRFYGLKCTLCPCFERVEITWLKNLFRKIELFFVALKVCMDKDNRNERKKSLKSM